MADGDRIKAVFRLLYRTYGPQGWWPASTSAEVVVGAVLTQNTSWKNVEKAIKNLKGAGLISIRRISSSSHNELARRIVPSGFFNVKAQRLLAVSGFIRKEYGGSLKKMGLENDTRRLRERLLEINGVGPETADCILLYALGKPFFVVDAYTRRIFSRLGILNGKASYDDLQGLFHRTLAPKTRLYNEYHALIVCHAKERCRKKPRCDGCVLVKLCPHLFA